jgi:hypothetical protein
MMNWLKQDTSTALEESRAQGYWTSGATRGKGNSGTECCAADHPFLLTQLRNDAAQMSLSVCLFILFVTRSMYYLLAALWLVSEENARRNSAEASVNMANGLVYS